MVVDGQGDFACRTEAEEARKEERKTLKKEGKSPGKEEEKGGSRAPHVASPLVGKISL